MAATYQTLQWTGPASDVLVNWKPVGAVPAIERWSVIRRESVLMDAIAFRNKRGESFGIANGTAFLTKAGIDPSGDLSAESLRRANAESFRCQELHEARLH